MLKSISDKEKIQFDYLYDWTLLNINAAKVEEKKEIIKEEKEKEVVNKPIPVQTNKVLANNNSTNNLNNKPHLETNQTQNNINNTYQNKRIVVNKVSTTTTKPLYSNVNTEGNKAPVRKNISSNTNSNYLHNSGQKAVIQRKGIQPKK